MNDTEKAKRGNEAEFISQIVRATPELPEHRRQFLIERPLWIKKLMELAFEPFNPDILKESLDIRFRVFFDGTSSCQWPIKLAKQKYLVSGELDRILMNHSLPVTLPCIANVVVVKGEMFPDEERTRRVIHEYARKCGFINPKPDLALVLRTMFTDDDINDMGLNSIVVMHDQISDDYPNEVAVMTYGHGRIVSNFLHTREADREYRFREDVGFAFLRF